MFIQSRFDAIVESRKKTRKGFKKNKVKTSKLRGYPLSVEKEYKSDLVKLAKKVNKSIIESVEPYLPRLIRSANQELGLKADAYESELNDIFKTARARVVEDLDENTLRRIAEKRGIEVSSKNLETLKSQFKSVVGIDIFSTEPYLTAKLTAFTSENVRLITSMGDDAIKRVEGHVFRGVSRGESLKTITENIKNSTGATISKAKLIARDQVASLNGELTRIRQTSNGIKGYIWSGSLDERQRDSHLANEGQYFLWSEPPSTGHPGDDINCRCVALPAFEEIESE